MLEYVVTVSIVLLLKGKIYGLGFNFENL